ncbi:MAG: hypothetical protein A2Y76_03265 [Planctomycetes bacterium RBG_13_60_9]|nr:MAG: hypothetical protein A2Y76_03265 [Planctomycetes bacterium RBG_13_60_9]
MDILDNFYNEITPTALTLQKFGETSFELNKSSLHGFVGISIQDTRTLLVGLQNILANCLGKPQLQLNIGKPEGVQANNDFLSAMKSVHRYFFISILTSLDAVGERICKESFHLKLRGESAFTKALSRLKSQEQTQWKLLYEGLKIVRNECAHPSLSDLHQKQIEKLIKGGLSFLINEGKFSISCSKYIPVSERAYECVSALKDVN